MNTRPTVSRYADQEKITVQPNTRAKVDDEGDSYEFSRISQGHYACNHGKTTHVIIEKDGRIGCSCENMTYRCTGNNVCKHIVKFLDLKVPPQIPASEEIIRKLSLMGWVGGKDGLHPAELLKTPTQSEPMEPEPKNKDDTNTNVSVTCQYCKMGATRKDQETADAWKRDHEAGCPKNPASVPEIPDNSNDETVVETDRSPIPEDETVADIPQKEDEVKSSTAVTRTEQRSPAVKREMPTEAEFQATKVGRLMKSQGSIYKVSGKEVADSAAVSSYAVSAGVSTETTVLEQTSEYARATVRAHKGGRYTEGSVLIRRDAILEKIMIDLAEKNPDWIIGWSGGLPEFDLNQKVFIGDKSKILGLHVAGVVADKWMFASRDCETKAGRRAQIKILGADWREDDEVESEVEEMTTVAKR